jgi:hypothetical protein
VIEIIRSHATTDQMSVLLEALSTCVTLVARWQRQWSRLWADPAQRQAMGDKARAWSDRVMPLSGLLA